MTAPEPPPSPTKAVDPLFVWHNKYLEQLRNIAETDEVPEGLDWPALREAIKVQIIKVVEEFQGAPRSPWLHPAAREAAQQQAAAQAKKEGESSSGGGVNGNSSNGQDATASSSTSTADAAAAALEDRFASSSSPTSAAASSTSAASTDQPIDTDADPPRSRRHSRQGARGLSEGSDGSAAPTSPGSDDDDDFDLPDANDVNLDLSSTTATAADRSGYYPAKTAPPATHNGSWGRLLTPAKQKEETYLCLQMLDGFESSPPFTIQRLAEVLLDPARFVRSAPKFTASLLRLLSVTAGHDDFPPVEPGVAPGAVNTVMMTNSNGGGGVDAGQQINGVGAVVGAVELQRMTGPPSPMAEPIFSPIPFLQRPRMEGGGQEEGQGDQGDDVPTLELGELAHPAAGVADTKAAGASAGAARGSNVVEPPPAPVVLQSATAASTSTAGQNAAPSQPPPAAPLGLSGIGPSELPSSSSSSSSSSQPLGVPPGRVDELDEYSGVANGTNPSTNTSNGGGGAGGPGDPSGQGSSSSATSASDGGSAAEGHQYGREVHPLSSTTTTTRAAPVDAVMADGEAGKTQPQGATTAAAAGGKGDEARMDEEEGDDGGHRAKRLKSEEPH